MAIGQCWLRAHDSRESAISAAWVRFRVLCLEKNFNKERGGECLKRIDREAIALRTGKTGLAASKRNDSYCTTIKVKVAARNDATATAILALDQTAACRIPSHIDSASCHLFATFTAHGQMRTDCAERECRAPQFARISELRI